MNNITKEIIQIKDNEINKENIAFIIYTNIEEDEEKIYTDISESVCRWLLKTNEVKLYVTDYENDYFKLENKDKVIYILNDNYEEKLKLKKIDNYQKIYEKENNIYSIYSYYEKDLDENIKFIPYSKNVYDYNGSEEYEIEEELLIGVEEIFAKETYKKSIFLTTYNLINNEIRSYEGYEYNIVKNDYNENNNIIEILNDTFETKLKYDEINDLKIDNLVDAYKEIYYIDFLNISDSSINKLNNIIENLELKLGKYRKIYLVNESDNEEDIINTFFVNMCTWAIVFDNAIIVVMYGSNE